jgi:ABC-type oligopeptide transport system substrate-binding subunit
VTRRRWIQCLPPAAALGVGACSSPEERADLVFISPAEPETLDPALASDQASSRVITALFEGLMRWNESGRSIPGVAEALPTVSADGLVHTF